MRPVRRRRLALTGAALTTLAVTAVGATPALASDGPPRRGGEAVASASHRFERCLTRHGERQFPEFGIYRVTDSAGTRHLELRAVPGTRAERRHYARGIRACGRHLQDGRITVPERPRPLPDTSDAPPVQWKD
ncbi:hypothetical protein [Streptomyces sp. NPDC052225]|uniref:hypothetical protein n=1 Tax=Streptomyces sp. NPDC052225 TaxID=3154949 RepID=UPI00343B1B06